MTAWRPASLLSLDFYARHFSALLAAAITVGFCLLVASAFTGRGGDLIVGDGIGYFEYARSLLIEHRLPTPFVKYPSGVAMVGILGYAPAVWITNTLVGSGAIANTESIRRGMGLFEQVAFCLPLIALAYVAFRANAGMLADLGFSDRVSKPAVLFWLVATNIGYFVLKEPAMSESATYSFVSLFYWGLIRWFWKPRTTTQMTPSFASLCLRAAAVGFFLGMAGAVRQQNILHALAVPLMLWKQPVRPMGERLRDLVMIAVVSAIFFSVPWMAWYATLGRFHLFMYCSWEHFNWLSPNPWAVLFVWGHHGLFVWHPLFLLAAIGLIGFLRSHRHLAPAWIVPLLIESYMVCTWYWPGFGASFGHRGFFTVFPLLLPAFAAFIDWAASRGKERPLLIGLCGLTAVNAVLALVISMQILDSHGISPENIEQAVQYGFSCPNLR